jgi:hypothetical protein
VSRWFRLYDEFLDDPKIQRLHPSLLKVLLNIWCVASRHDGRLPSHADLSFSLRMSEDETFRAVSKLAEAGFIDTDAATGEQRPHGWDCRQFRSDTSTDRVRAHRKRQKTAIKPDPTPPNGNGAGNGDETFHATPPEADTEQSSVTDVTGTVVPHPAMDFVKAVFDGGIRLLRRDDPEMSERSARSIVGRWRKAVTDAELITILMEAETKSQSLEWVTAAVETRNGTRTRQPAVQQAAHGLRGPRPDPAVDLLRQARAEQEAGFGEDEGGDSQAWASLPSYLTDRS